MMDCGQRHRHRAPERIAEEAKAKTGSLDLSKLDLTELPDELAALTHLHSLEHQRKLASGDPKSDNLEPLRALVSLNSLHCSYTQVSDLEPLRALVSLNSLDCS